MAALFDCKTGQYLIQRCVLRVAPSLRVARTAAETLRGMKEPERKGHALVVGNPLPTRCEPLPTAEVEAKFVAELLSGVGFEVQALMGQAATKSDVQKDRAKWGHLTCHGVFDIDKNALMLAVEVEEEEEEEEEKTTSSSGKKHTLKPKKGRKKTLKLGAGKRRAGGGGGGGELRGGSHDGGGAGERAYGDGVHRGVECVLLRVRRDQGRGRGGPCDSLARGFLFAV